MEEKTSITIGTYNKCAVAFQDKFMNMDLYHKSYDRLCERIETVNPRILEIGCGPGNITRYLLSKRPDFDILATDLAEKMIVLATVNVPQAKFRVMDCREILSINETFDAIVCGFCMPYLSDDECAKLIADMAALLNPGGTVYFSTMEGDDSRSGFETTSFSGSNEVYVNYHQSDFLEKQLVQNGFENIELIVQGYPEPDGTISDDLIFIAAKC
ncbi:MAG TPA: class I SAM-dependent methyltransferase [Prolixibacteraceae bacterium]|nr:class I SAM-dependent methyltransferase [Prolixibacteraceae bacterium]HQN92483.1 class I SAM-dependent methyltransferase [Prolixibacteraceae bacterium]HUM87885.1 class I SAM-dependent methyltransferase [Prolixibacteraceae bacterium]